MQGSQKAWPQGRVRDRFLGPLLALQAIKAPVSTHHPRAGYNRQSCAARGHVQHTVSTPVTSIRSGPISWVQHRVGTPTQKRTSHVQHTIHRMRAEYLQHLSSMCTIQLAGLPRPATYAMPLSCLSLRSSVRHRGNLRSCLARSFTPLHDSSLRFACRLSLALYN